MKRIKEHEGFFFAAASGWSYTELGRTFFGDYADPRREAQRYYTAFIGEFGSAPEPVVYSKTPALQSIIPPPALPREVKVSNGRNIELNGVEIYDPELETLDDKHWFLEGNFGLIADIHSPYYDPKVISEAVQTTLGYGIHRMIWMGDTIDSNQWRHRKGNYKRSDRTYQEDVEVTEKLIESVLKYIDEIYIFRGNHDEWFEHVLQGQMKLDWTLERLFNKFEGRVHWSDYERAYVKSGDQEWNLVHGANYSSANPLRPVQELAAKFGTNVAMGHQHHAASGLDRSGRYQVVALGAAADPRKLDYLHRSPRTNPAATQGYGVLVDGVVHQYIIAK